MTRPRIDEERLKQIEDAAAALLVPRDIARLLSLSQDETEYFLYAIRQETDDDFVRAYWKGRTETKLSLHETVVKLALKGSPAAQPLADAYLHEPMR